ncbi:hypothetical protein [Bordetella bronchiseptica]|uniref:hypothetical protein n=1 Tax=Bordetella bronchiseptica TaxID=518 RepID=UPI000460CFC5|nr:hypothetical protein [Bordetella bronchiseptica]KAB1444950.1 hypothetical protein F7D00_18730 [Bordetella bronchiseptica]KAB1571170.1 hypothetical protein F7890_18730 [Bordetella bronchiseptica]KDD10948.1 hypothetical protein L523_1443 [Bordetella bronchiseptica MBORD731]
MNAPTTPRKPLVVGWLYEGIVPPVFTDSVVVYREWLRQGHENISPVIRKSDADAYYVPDGEVRVECAPDPRGVGIGVWVGSRCIYSGAHAVPPGAPAPNADDAPPRFTISASDRFELTGAVGLLRGYGCAGAADALQRVLDAEMDSFSVQGEDAASDARDAAIAAARKIVSLPRDHCFIILTVDVESLRDKLAALDAAITAYRRKGGAA